MQHRRKLNGVWLIATVIAISGNWCAAEDTVEEVVVTVPRTLVETRMLDYGLVRVRSVGPNFGYDGVSFYHKTHEVPSQADAFGVRLLIKATPRRRIGIAEVWSHPELLHTRTGQPQGRTILLHTLDPPFAYTFYFPANEFETRLAGDWTMQLFLIEKVGPGLQNVEFYGDPMRFSAANVTPFFETQFQVQPP